MSSLRCSHCGGKKIHVDHIDGEYRESIIRFQCLECEQKEQFEIRSLLSFTTLKDRIEDIHNFLLKEEWEEVTAGHFFSEYHKSGESRFITLDITAEKILLCKDSKIIESTIMSVESLKAMIKEDSNG